MDISVSLEVYKALTARLMHDGQTYDDVIRDALKMDSIIEPDVPAGPLEGVANAFARPIFESGGFISRGLWLPNGTKLRARYKHKQFLAEIQNDTWVDHLGESQSSPSAAASAITGTTVNGLRFWEAQKPGQQAWRRLDALRQL
ncbi:hypothetical protein [Sphingomonas immobilis]|uniref:DUF4357 domain-containing protein n=1 Tax=Sphingomonas immobilis TaxID=3063997 RepID=A0ABT9A2G2_9SPHN|nr:hypothetical protein [Sphingomonas sp. CA1-15]MDO7844032.1 hypothetical protein [Sphingomonas sp. CA1-15]